MFKHYIFLCIAHYKLIWEVSITDNHLTKYLNTNQQTGANSRTKYISWQTNILIRTQTHKRVTQTGPFFRENLTTLMNNTIPNCYTNAKTNLPWITRELIRMLRRRNKNHKKAKQTGLNKHWDKFRELRRQTTKALATSYKSYATNQIGNSLKNKSKTTLVR